MSERGRITRPRRGFTILELLVVVTVMAILAAMSVGKTDQIMNNWRLNRAAQAWSEELQIAFSLVGRNRKPVVIEFRTDSMNLTLRSRADAAGNTTLFHRRNFGRDSEYKLNSGNLSFSLAAAATNDYTLEVYPPGLAADSLSVMISRNGLSKRIRMLRGGLVQICTSKDPSKC
jgi:prepilin-type N-terminal cleavage/methylation domain-containing protein